MTGEKWQSVYTAKFPPSTPSSPVLMDVEASLPLEHVSPLSTENPLPLLVSETGRYPKRARRAPRSYCAHGTEDDDSSSEVQVGVGGSTPIDDSSSSCAPTKVRVAVHSMKRAHRAPPHMS